MAIFSVLAKNLTDSGKGYTYSYVDQSDISSNDSEAVKGACEIFTGQYIRNIGDNYWGFIVYPEEVNGAVSYSVSLRSVNDVKDVSGIAGELGGGGHKAAAGAKGIIAPTALEAVKKVEAVIDS